LPYHYEYDVDLCKCWRIVDCGDVPAIPGNAERTFEIACQMLKEIYSSGARPIIIVAIILVQLLVQEHYPRYQARRKLV